jgi:hypothetical protein
MQVRTVQNMEAVKRISLIVDQEKISVENSRVILGPPVSQIVQLPLGTLVPLGELINTMYQLILVNDCGCCKGRQEGKSSRQCNTQLALEIQKLYENSLGVCTVDQ